MPKAKSLTILGVRGLKVHERTPPFSRPTFWVECPDLVIRDAAVQALLWEQSFDDNPRDADFEQRGRWREVFRAAMRRYERDSGKPSSCEKENKR